MRHSIDLFIRALIIFPLALLVACSDDDGDPTTVAGEQMQKLAGSWHATAVEVDDTPAEGFDDFVITLAPVQGRERMSYIINNNAYRTPWEAVSTGYFTFHADEPATYLVREDGVPVSYTVSETTLTMSFMYEESASGGRLAGVSGTWEFTFEKTP